MMQGKSHGGFEFRTLQVFVATAEQGGMTRAAEVLGMTQSGVSQTIAVLEESVGRQLFDRSVRPIVLTGAGQALLARGKKILGEMQQAYREAAEIEQVQLARLSITMPESLANVLGPPLFHRAKEMARSWQISNGLFPDQLARFNSHAADIMITDESHVASMIDIERHTIATEPHILIFPRGFALGMDLGSHLAASDLLRFSLRSSLGRKTEAQLNRLNLKFPDRIEFDSVVGHTSAVARGSGWGITTPLCLAQTPALIEKLEVHPITRGGFSRKLVLVAREAMLGSATQMVAAHCHDILREEVFPMLFERMPWLEGVMQVGDD